MKFRLMFYTAVYSLLAATSLQAAPITVPTGLNLGDQYRLAFVTSGTRDATSTDIADYNTFVQSAADAVPQLLSLGATWNTIGSTASVHAYTNTGTNPLISTGVPIYLLNDTKLVNDNGDLWDGSLLADFDVDELGVTPSTSIRVWTGTNFLGGARPHFLGNAIVGTGQHTSVDAAWVADFAVTNLDLNRMYAVSTIFTVVPEPSSIMLVGMACAGVLVRRRHRN